VQWEQVRRHMDNIRRTSHTPSQHGSHNEIDWRIQETSHDFFDYKVQKPNLKISKFYGISDKKKVFRIGS